MMTEAEISSRIRERAPDGCDVLEGSLPVVAFGDPQRASVATLSLNPSDLEFTADGTWLTGPQMRLESLRSLGVVDPAQLSDDQVARVVRKSNEYFQGPWYQNWFGWLERLLVESGAGSYLDGSACHLDVVQWATAKKQGKLHPEVWQRLVQRDSAFLRWQLEVADLEVVLVNGRAVAETVEASGLVPRFHRGHFDYRASTGRSLRISTFQADVDGVRWVGWNKPVAGAISLDGREKLAAWVRESIAEAPRTPRPRDGS